MSSNLKWSLILVLVGWNVHSVLSETLKSHPRSRCPLENSTECYGNHTSLNCLLYQIKFLNITELSRPVITDLIIYSNASVIVKNGEEGKGVCFISVNFARSKKKFKSCFVYYKSNETSVDLKNKKNVKSCHCICLVDINPVLTKNEKLFNDLGTVTTEIFESHDDENESWTFHATPLEMLKKINADVQVKKPKNMKSCTFMLYKIYSDHFLSCVTTDFQDLINITNVPLKNKKCHHVFENVLPGNYCVRVYREPTDRDYIYYQQTSIAEVKNEPQHIYSPTEPEKNQQWVYIVIGCLLAIIVLIGLGSAAIYKISHQRTDSIQNENENENKHTVVSQLKNNKILLIHDDDDDDLIPVIEKLKTVLEKYFNCTVSYHDAEANYQFDQNQHNYVTEELKSDKIFIINSAGAYWKYDKYLRQTECQSTSFHLMLDYLNRLRNTHKYNYKKITHIRFPFTPTNCMLNDVVSDKSYLLPDNFKDLYFYVHGAFPNEECWSAITNDLIYTQLGENIRLIATKLDSSLADNNTNQCLSEKQVTETNLRESEVNRQTGFASPFEVNLSIDGDRSEACLQRVATSSGENSPTSSNDTEFSSRSPLIRKKHVLPGVLSC